MITMFNEIKNKKMKVSGIIIGENPIENVIICDIVEGLSWDSFCIRHRILFSNVKVQKIYDRIFAELNSDEDPEGLEESLNILGLN